MDHSQPLFLYFCLFNTVDNDCMNQSLPMTGFEPWTSGVRSNRSTNCATTTALTLATVCTRICNWILQTKRKFTHCNCNIQLWTIWTDLATNFHFGKILTVFGNFNGFTLLVIGIILLLGEFSLLEMAKYRKKSRIRSHWSWSHAWTEF